ncbi:Oidioi.mRNA.OKI2018_I69.XSR.g14112.t1.cds [Oikopleura dioica]|uniref:Oidioi.mRNA.OKI2018_I69.XSR.g14112.t1.cds n=1 Tax=Oikopleura dioica TaxID=34765 RepID=A0ABN7S8U5_OIKDI|nr:Oidioi.mRNA.OKI2018_I69.XSR.g14112.t1.cds [Oikopleura dioica]
MKFFVAFAFGYFLVSATTFHPWRFVDYDYEEDSTPPPASIYDNLNKNPKAMKDLMRLKSAFTMYNLLEKNSKRSSPYLSSSNYE